MVQTTLVLGVGVDSQLLLVLWQIAVPYAAQIVARKQLELPPMLQPPVLTKHEMIRLL